MAPQARPVVQESRPAGLGPASRQHKDPECQKCQRPGRVDRDSPACIYQDIVEDDSELILSDVSDGKHDV